MNKSTNWPGGAKDAPSERIIAIPAWRELTLRGVRRDHSDCYHHDECEQFGDGKDRAHAVQNAPKKADSDSLRVSAAELANSRSSSATVAATESERSTRAQNTSTRPGCPSNSSR